MGLSLGRSLHGADANTGAAGLGAGRAPPLTSPRARPPLCCLWRRQGTGRPPLQFSRDSRSALLRGPLWLCDLE